MQNNLLKIGAVIGGICAALLVARTGHAEDWLQFRGANAGGAYAGDIRTQWSDDQNLNWALALPGNGVSSPIVVKDRVFVTCYTEYGEDVNDPRELSKLRRHLICVDRKTGQILWQRSPPTRFPEDNSRVLSPTMDMQVARQFLIERSQNPFQGRSGNSVGPAQLLMTFDVNNDDMISPEELAESPMPKFVQSMKMTRGDKNKDGFIDAEERAILQESMQTRPGEVIGRKNAANRPLRPALLSEPR